VAEPATAYTIIYKVTTDGNESTETITARRPFESRVELRRGDALVARRVSRFGELVLEGEGIVRRLAVPPALGTSDVRPDVVLDDATKRGLAERREVRTIADRPCQVYRLGSTASDGTLVPIGTNEGEHADLCVDGRGLVLDEVWVQGGVTIRHRVAVDVDDHATIDESTFRLDGEGTAIDGRVHEEDAGESSLPATPAGFERRGHFSVTPAQLQTGTGEIPPPRTTSSDVWMRGNDFLVLERGVGAVAPHPYAIDIDLPHLGPAALIVDLRASEVRVDTPDGNTLRLYGTVAPSELLAIAAELLQAATG
jgi:hypothetical protein